MKMEFSLAMQDKWFVLNAQGKPMRTPSKQIFAIAEKSLAAAILEEWQKQRKYTVSGMPLTSLAYTAIDRIAAQEHAIVEALMVYIDTDALSYRATGSEDLWRQQEEQWNPVLGWIQGELGVTWETTQGIMPIEQPEALHEAIQRYMHSLDAMHLAAACVLASGFSSIALAYAVLRKKLEVAEAFRLSQLEEESQAERWGRDAEAGQRAVRLRDEMLAAGQFLKLLDDRQNHH